MHYMTKMKISYKIGLGIFVQRPKLPVTALVLISNCMHRGLGFNINIHCGHFGQC